MLMKTRRAYFVVLLAAAAVTAIVASGISLAEAPEVAPEQAIFPGQANPEISAGIINAYNHALNREYDQAREICLELGKKFPDNPAVPVGETVLYQVKMLENEDFELDADFKDAGERALSAASRFADQAPKNDWYYTLLGATWGIQGIYHLRQDDYLTGGYYGAKGLYYMQLAERMNPENYEARLGVGLYIYYRSAYSHYIPLPWLDQREAGIAMVREAGEKRPYLSEVSKIALFYIYLEEEDYDTATDWAVQLILARPDYPIFYHFAGWARLEAYDYSQGYIYYLKMHELDPSLYFPCYKLGRICMRMGQNDEANMWFDKFFQTLGDRDSVHKKRAQRYQKQLGA